MEHGFAQGLVAGWQRVHEGERVQVLINYGAELAQVQMERLPPNARLLSALPEGGAQAARADAGGRASLYLGPQSVRVLVVSTSAKAAVRKPGARQKAQRAAAKQRAARQKAARPAAR